MGAIRKVQDTGIVVDGATRALPDVRPHAGTESPSRALASYSVMPRPYWEERSDAGVGPTPRTKPRDAIHTAPGKTRSAPSEAKHHPGARPDGAARQPGAGETCVPQTQIQVQAQSQVQAQTETRPQTRTQAQALAQTLAQTSGADGSLDDILDFGHVDPDQVQGTPSDAHGARRLWDPLRRRRRRKAYYSRRVRLPRPKPHEVAIIACAICAPVAALVLIGCHTHALSGVPVLMAVAGVSLVALAVLAIQARLYLTSVLAVVALHVPALVASLTLLGTAEVADTCWHAVGCLVAFWPAEFSIGVILGMRTLYKYW